MRSALNKAIQWTEQGAPVPDAVVRHGIRRLINQRRDDIHADDCERAARETRQFLESMSGSDIALLPDLANDQHYELPPAFFEQVLGARRKYSCSYWPDGNVSLDEAEEASLRATCARARIADGDQILELGCGWGSLTLWMAEHYPASRIVAVSNSNAQRQHIEARARASGLQNVEVLTRDMNEFTTDDRFDCIVSVEMFEHMRNWGRLFRRIRGWLVDDGLLFLHFFCHRSIPYAYQDQGPADWMSRYYFSGGMMPCDDLPLRFPRVLESVDHWRWDGRHYERTANAWLANMDAAQQAIWPLLEETYGADNAQLWWTRWRLFFMAVAEMFGTDNGQEWFVAHHLLQKQS